MAAISQIEQAAVRTSTLDGSEKLVERTLRASTSTWSCLLGSRARRLLQCKCNPFPALVRAQFHATPVLGICGTCCSIVTSTRAPRLDVHSHHAWGGDHAVGYLSAIVCVAVRTVLHLVTTHRLRSYRHLPCRRSCSCMLLPCAARCMIGFSEKHGRILSQSSVLVVTFKRGPTRRCAASYAYMFALFCGQHTGVAHPIARCSCSTSHWTMLRRMFLMVIWLYRWTVSHVYPVMNDSLINGHKRALPELFLERHFYGHNHPNTSHGRRP
jgi:hypothetical protein